MQYIDYCNSLSLTCIIFCFSSSVLINPHPKICSNSAPVLPLGIHTGQDKGEGKGKGGRSQSEKKVEVKVEVEVWMYIYAPTLHLFYLYEYVRVRAGKHKGEGKDRGDCGVRLVDK